MKHQLGIVLFVVALWLGIGGLAGAKDGPSADGPDPLEAQPSQKDQADKKKPPAKDKEKPAPLAISDFLPQEQLNLAGEAVPQAPEMLGDVEPFGTLLKILPRAIQVPPLIRTFQTINAVGQVITVTQVIPRPPIIVPGGSVFVPMGSGGFKIADNNSPMPQDRVYVSFNAFDDAYASTNSRLGTGVQNMSIYRESFGMEKTFLGGDASAGMILPLNTLYMQSPVAVLNGSNTALGDLSMFARYALFRDDDSNNWITGGLALTVPSGPSTFAGIAGPSPVPHTTIFQPFGSYLWNFGNLYLQGFLSLYTPAEHAASPTLLFNDVALGYFIYRAPIGSRFVTGVAPTFEVHVADPLNDRGAVTATNPFGAFDLVDVGLGLNVLMGAGSRLGIGVVTPVTGPRPFNVETLVQFRIRF